MRLRCDHKTARSAVPRLRRTGAIAVFVPQKGLIASVTIA
jgi:hypothetical protein